MWTGKRIKTIISIMALLIGVCWVTVEPAWAGALIDKVKLSPEGLPEGWKLVSEYKVPEAQAKRFEAKFAAPIAELLNQVFKVDGKKELRINYLASSSENYAKDIYIGLW